MKKKMSLWWDARGLDILAVIIVSMVVLVIYYACSLLAVTLMESGNPLLQSLSLVVVSGMLLGGLMLFFTKFN